MSCSCKGEYGLLALKRDWVPEWLWSMLGCLVLYWPLTWILTREPTREEILKMQQGEHDVAD
jgi:hypothetical protein